MLLLRPGTPIESWKKIKKYQIVLLEGITKDKKTVWLVYCKLSKNTAISLGSTNLEWDEVFVGNVFAGWRKTDDFKFYELPKNALSQGLWEIDR